MKDEAMAYSQEICFDLLSSFRRLDLFEETLSNRVVKSINSTYIIILHYDGSQAAEEHKRAFFQGWS